MIDYRHKYFKYKLKYLDLKNQNGGVGDEHEQNIETKIEIEEKKLTQEDIKILFDKDNSLAFIDSLNKSSANIIYRDALDQNNSDTLIVNFAGEYDNFNELYNLATSPTHIMLFCDKNNYWYYNILPKIIEYIKKFIKDNDIKKVILFGTSMGGYASLYCSSFIDNCICIAMNPQTFPKLKNHPYYIYPENSNDVKYTSAHIYDLRKVFTDNPNNSKKYILTSRWECEISTNCNNYWHDLVYSGYLMGIPNVILIFVPLNGHKILGYYKYDKFIKNIFYNYDTLIEDMNKGKHILNNLVYIKIFKEKEKLKLKSQYGGVGEIKYAYMTYFKNKYKYNYDIDIDINYHCLLTLKQIQNNKDILENYEIIDIDINSVMPNGEDFKTLYKNASNNWILELINNDNIVKNTYVSVYINEIKSECEKKFHLKIKEELDNIEETDDELRKRIDIPKISMAAININIKEITQQNILDNYKKYTHKYFIESLAEDPSIINMIYRCPLNEENSDTLVVNFAGSSSNFSTLYNLAKSQSHIMLFRDKNNYWYYNILPKIIEYIKKFIIDKKIKKVILFGISMGGYASLYCSNFIDNCICIAMNPQTFPKLKNHPYYIYHEEMPNIIYTPAHIYDLRKVFTENSNNSKKYILSSIWECNNTSNCGIYWHDLLYSSYLMGLPNIVIVYSSQIGHNIFGYYNYDKFMQLISEKYDILVNNMDEGKKILNNLEYK